MRPEPPPAKKSKSKAAKTERFLTTSTGGLGDFLKWFIDRYDRGYAAELCKIRKELVIMQEKLNQVGSKIDQNTAKADKAFAEIRAALDEALEAQITQEELDAAVEAAKAAQKSESESEMDAALQPILDKLSAQESALQKLDDIVPDAPTEPPVEPPTEPPVE
jgi:uncharacterized protein (DUF3084 family)